MFESQTDCHGILKFFTAMLIIFEFSAKYFDGAITKFIFRFFFIFQQNHSLRVSKVNSLYLEKVCENAEASDGTSTRDQAFT